jgi:hypothetical protein
MNIRIIIATICLFCLVQKPTKKIVKDTTTIEQKRMMLKKQIKEQRILIDSLIHEKDTTKNRKGF